MVSYKLTQSMTLLEAYYERVKEMKWTHETLLKSQLNDLIIKSSFVLLLIRHQLEWHLLFSCILVPFFLEVRSLREYLTNSLVSPCALYNTCLINLRLTLTGWYNILPFIVLETLYQDVAYFVNEYILVFCKSLQY